MEGMLKFYFGFETKGRMELIILKLSEWYSRNTESNEIKLTLKSKEGGEVE